MVRFFEKQDKEEIIKLAEVFIGERFRREVFSAHFDEIVAGKSVKIGISVLHAGEYLGYCVAEKKDTTVTIKQLYIKPSFQKLKVAPQVLDFIKSEFTGFTLQAVCPMDNMPAVKLFTKHNVTII